MAKQSVRILKKILDEHPVFHYILQRFSLVLPVIILLTIKF